MAEYVDLLMSPSKKTSAKSYPEISSSQAFKRSAFITDAFKTVQVKTKSGVDQVPESFLQLLAGPSVNKAGLKRDPDEVRQIIYNCSRSGKFFEQKKKKDEDTTKQIKQMLDKLERDLDKRNWDVTPEEKEADIMIRRLELGRDMTQSICVVDCDAFYASVEELHDPTLKGIAFGVGEGVLTTASYEARKYGARSAMPGFVARKLCPHIKFVKADFAKYTAASKSIMDILSRYDPNMAPASLDEAYMNLTEYMQNNEMTADEVVAHMRAAVKEETGLTVSAGVAPTTTIAKMAADVNKPDGQFILPPDREAIMAFMADMSVRKIPGVGAVSQRWLEAIGIVKIRDIYEYRGRLSLSREGANLKFLLGAYLGLIGERVVEPGKREDRVTVGRETTFSPKEAQDYDGILEDLADQLYKDLERLQFSGRTINLKIKLDTYESMTRSFTPGGGVTYHDKEQILKKGLELLHREQADRARAFDEGRPIKGKGRELKLRLLGLRISNLVDLKLQGTKAEKRSIGAWLGGDKNSKKQKAEESEASSDELSFVRGPDPKSKATSSKSTNLARSFKLPSPASSSSTPEKPTKAHSKASPSASPFKEANRPSQAIVLDSASEDESTKPKKAPLHVCPVCQKSLYIAFEVFARHVDKCLEDSVAPMRQQKIKQNVTKSGEKNVFSVMMKAKKSE